MKVNLPLNKEIKSVFDGMIKGRIQHCENHKIKFVFIQLFWYEQNLLDDEFLGGVQLVRIKRFTLAKLLYQKSV